MKMQKIKVVQIGITHEHASGKMYALRKLPDLFEIVGFVDDRSFSVTPSAGYDFVNPYQGLHKLSLEEALDYPGLQAAVVEVPNNELVPVAMRCMEHGLAMHMDKPAGETLAPYRRLLDGCKAKNLPFQMGYMFRGSPAFQFCLDAVRSNILGDIFEITADMNHCYGNEEYQQYIGRFSGGLMFNLGCHLIDFVVAAMGCPEKVTPFLQSAPGYPDHIKNNCMAVLEYPHALVSLRSCSTDPGNTYGRSMKIAGTNGTVQFSPLERFDGKSVEINMTLRNPAGEYGAGNHSILMPPQDNRYTAQLRELAAMIHGKAESAYSFEHDLMVHGVTLAAAGYTKW